MQCVPVPWSHASLVLPCNVAAPPWAVKLINSVDAVHTEQRHQGEVLRQQGEVLRQQGEVQRQQGEVLKKLQGDVIELQEQLLKLRGDFMKTHVTEPCAADCGNRRQP